MTRVAIALAGVLLSLPAPAKDDAPLNNVPLKVINYDYGSDAALAPLDKTFQMALLDLGWVPSDVSASGLTAQLTVRRHYAKIRIEYGNGQASIKLLDSRELNAEPCVYIENGKRLRGPCIHPKYYDWIENITSSLTVANARVKFIQSLKLPGE